MMRPWTPTLRLFALLIAMPAAAHAQAMSGASVSGSVSAVNVESHTSVAYTAAFEYRFSPVVGFEVEATFVPPFNLPFPGGGIAEPVLPLLPTIRLENEGGRAVIWSNNVRLTIPTTTPRLEPFFVAGGGVASLKHTADYRLSFPAIGILDLPGLAGLAGLLASNNPSSLTYPVTSSSANLALTIGGGASFKTTSHLWIDADLRLIRVLGVEDHNIGRFGAGVRYRF